MIAVIESNVALQILLGCMTATPPAPATASYSVDQFSPTVDVYVDFVHLPDDLFIAFPPGEMGEDAGGAGPLVAYDGEMFPRHSIGIGGSIDVDGISSNHGLFRADCLVAYHVVFGVTLNSSGQVDTPLWDQWLRIQEPGDLFVSTQRFHGVLPDGPPDKVRDPGHELLINQDALLLVPTIGPEDFNDRFDLDELDAFDFSLFDLNGDGTLDTDLYYSVSQATDPGFGAIIFRLPRGYDSPPRDPFEAAATYADPIDLLLTTQDEIDAIVVFDGGTVGEFDAGDAVLLSLRALSPSLLAGGTYSFGRHYDAFLLYRDEDNISHLSVFADGEADLLLDPAHDDIDALEVLRIDTPGDCVAIEAAWDRVRGR